MAFLLASVLGAFTVAVYQLQRVSRLAAVDNELQTRVTALTKAVREEYRDGPPPGGRGPRDFDGPRGGPFEPNERKGHRGPPKGPPRDHGFPPPRERMPPPPDSMMRANFALPAETAAMFNTREGYYFTIWRRDGGVLQKSANAPVSPVPGAADRDMLPHFRTRGDFREAIHCSGFGDCSMAGRSIGAELGWLRSFRLGLLGVGGAVLALGLAVGWWITSRATRPMERMSAAASRIAAGDLSERVPVTDSESEVGRLGSVLNSTFDRLQAAFDRQQQFTADAAHEMRTPLAVIISETQTTLARERTAAEYRETVEGCLDTAQQMRRITETLLLLTRIDGGEAAVSRQEVDLADVARDCMQRLDSLAKEHQVSVHTELGSAAAFSVRERLEQVVLNLAANAIYYNRPGGEVRLTTLSEDGYAVLKVADNGIGIAAAELPHVFDRFYRVDKARSQAQGHTGLGLAICKTIVEAERGTIDVSSVLGQGTAFTVRIPSQG